MDINKEDLIETDINYHFAVGQKLGVVRTFADDLEDYPSYVKDINDNSILIDTPSKSGIPIPMYAGGEIKLIAIKDENIFSGNSTVLSLEKGSVQGIWVSCPEYLEKIQRREFVRWEFKFPIKLCILDKDKVVEEINSECINLSGGGIAIFSSKRIAGNVSLRINFKYEELYVDSAVRIVGTSYDSYKKYYVLRLEFVDLSERIVDKIHKLITKEQLELRRKGLI